MKNLLLVIPLFALAACEGSIANAVGGGWSGGMEDGQTISTDATDPGSFNAVSLLGPDNVVFTVGAEHSIRAEGDDEVIQRLRFELEDGSLKIGRVRERGWSGYDKAATVFVSAPSLRAAKLAGSGNLNVDQLTGEDAAVSVAGSGNLLVEAVDADKLDAKVTGSGDMKISGKAKNVSAKVTGSGKFGGKDFTADSAELKVTGSGDVIMSSEGEVDAKVTGSGDIRVYGNAKCTSKTTGSGEVTCG